MRSTTRRRLADLEEKAPRPGLPDLPTLAEWLTYDADQQTIPAHLNATGREILRHGHSALTVRQVKEAVSLIDQWQEADEAAEPNGNQYLV